MASKPFYYTSDEIIKSVKSRALVPDVQSTFSDDDFLRFANEEMALGMVPSIIEHHEDYFLRTDLIPLEQGKTKYDIPYRAIGNRLREVAVQDQNGNIYEMTRIGVGDLPTWNTNGNTTDIYAFYIQNNQVCLVPENLTTIVASGQFLRMSYYIRPNTLVLLKDVAVISSIDRNTGTINVSNFPSDYTLNETYDFVQVKSPHRSVAIEVSATSVNPTSKTLTFALADIPAELGVGDHIAMSTESAIPQIPSDLHVVLAHRVATRILEAIGDTEGLQNANAKLQEFEAKMTPVIDNRVEDAPRKIVNIHSTLRRGLRRGWRR